MKYIALLICLFCFGMTIFEMTISGLTVSPELWLIAGVISGTVAMFIKLDEKIGGGK